MQHLKLFEEFTTVGTEGTLDPKAQREKYKNSFLPGEDLEEIRDFMESKGLEAKASYDPISKDKSDHQGHGGPRLNPFVDDLIGKLDQAVNRPWANYLQIVNPKGNRGKGKVLTLTVVGILSIPMGRNASEAEAKARSKFWADKGYPFKVVKSSEGEPGILIGYDPTSFKTPEGKKKLMEDVLGYMTSQ